MRSAIAILLLTCGVLLAQPRPPRPCRGAGDKNCTIVADQNGVTNIPGTAAIGATVPTGAPANSQAIGGQVFINGATPLGVDSYPTLTRFRSALAKGTASVAVISSSSGEGTGATTRAKGWAYVFASRLQAVYGNAGPGYIGAHRTDIYTFVGTWTPYTGYNVDGQYAAGDTNTVTMSAQTCASYVIYFGGPVTDFEVSVDSGSWETVTGAAPSGGTIKQVTVSAGSLGSHTIAIRPKGATTLYFYGVNPVVAATGVTVHNISITGATSGTYGGLATQSNILTNLAPDLVIISLDNNDVGASVTAATYTTQMTNITNKAVSTGASILLFGQQPIAVTDSSGAAIKAAMIALAQTGGFDYINVKDRWKSYTIASALGIYADTLHPNDAGHLDIADFLTEHVAPQLASKLLGSGVTASGASCTITAITGGIITAATCTP